MKHSLYETCSCEACERHRFEAKVTLILIGSVMLTAGIAWLVTLLS